MIETCCLYLPVKYPPIKKMLPACKSDGGLLRNPSWFHYQVEGDGVKLNLMPEAEHEAHLRGFKGYLAQLSAPEVAKAEAFDHIDAVKSVLGVSFDHPVSPDSPVFQSLFFILDTLNGFMFINDSVVLGDGRCLVGPMSQQEDTEIDDTLQPEDFKHQRETDGLDPELVAMRERHYFELARRRFRCATWLPIKSADQTVLRPLSEIVARVCALNALVNWVVNPKLRDELLQAFVERHALHEHLTPPELEILALPRSEAQDAAMNTIGWKLENMWALCWVLGFDPAPPFYQGQLPGEISQAMIFGFLPHMQGNTEIAPDRFKPRSRQQVIELEDLYYCCHNAVRSAQVGKPAVPRGFHPIYDGGAIHERRHALSWCLEPESSWDTTDLST